MNLSRLLALLAVVVFSSCKQDAPPPPPAPAPVAKPTPPPEPKVELAAAPALPPTPAGLPELKDSEENPTTPEKADLGHKLFFDKRLSKDGSMACVACHLIDKAYTSGAETDAKVGGAMNSRNAPTMLNVGYHSTFYWDGRMPTLEAVSNAAWKGQLGADPAATAAALNKVPAYKAMFQRAFKEDATADNVPKALAAWLRALKTGNSAWDKAQAGDKAALSKDATAGFALFTKKGCVTCHVPPLFTDLDFHNAGIGEDAGRKDATKDEADVGRFKTPSLRNVAITAPYFHDGKTATLEEAIAFMAKGGNKNPHLDAKFKPQKLSKKEAEQLKAFLESLSGESTYSAEPELP